MSHKRCCLVIVRVLERKRVKITCCLSDLTEKEVAGAFWNGELEAECRERKQLDFFGLMKLDGDRERVMEKIESIR